MALGRHVSLRVRLVRVDTWRAIRSEGQDPRVPATCAAGRSGTLVRDISRAVKLRPHGEPALDHWTARFARFNHPDAVFLDEMVACGERRREKPSRSSFAKRPRHRPGKVVK